MQILPHTSQYQVIYLEYPPISQGDMQAFAALITCLYTGGGEGVMPGTCTLKGLSYEIDFEYVDVKLTDLGLNKGRGWFLNFSKVPLMLK
jgi:hypothetical protein